MAQSLVPTVAPRGPSDVWVGGSSEGFAYLAHFDGAVWTGIEPPMRAAIVSTSALLGGIILAATADGQLWRNDGGLSRTQVTLPPGTVARQVRVVAADDIWVAGGKRVLLSRPPKQVTELVQQLPDPTGRELGLEGVPPSEPATPACSSIFVSLYTVSEHADEHYDFPIARAALKGHKEFAAMTFGFEESGQFGAVSPSYELGRELVALATRTMKNAAPRMICKVASMTRLRFNWDTGEVLH